MGVRIHHANLSEDERERREQQVKRMMVLLYKEVKKNEKEREKN